MTTETTPVRPDVPITLHPDALLGVGRVLDVANTLGPLALAAGREALGTMYRTFANMQDAEKALLAAAPPAVRRQQPVMAGGNSEYIGDWRAHNGQVRPFHGREAEFAEAAEQAFNGAAMAVDRRLKELEGYREALGKRVAEAIDTPTRRTSEGLALAAEVRAHIKSLAEGKRWSFVADVIQGGDRATVAAVLAAPPFLSGLTPRQHETARDLAARKFAPVDHEQHAATGEVIERVKAASQHLLGRYTKALELKNTPSAKASANLAKLRGAK